MVGQWVTEYRTEGFGAGCPIAAATIDCAETTEAIRTHIEAALDTWRRPIAAALADMGVPRRKATALATVMLSALEGAIILARATHSVEPLTTVSRELGPFLDGYVAPRAEDLARGRRRGPVPNTSSQRQESR
jgi:hypothetical protein